MLGVKYYDCVGGKLGQGRTNCHDGFSASIEIICATFFNMKSSPRVTGMVLLENRKEKEL